MVGSSDREEESWLVSVVTIAVDGPAWGWGMEEEEEGLLLSWLLGREDGSLLEDEAAARRASSCILRRSFSA